MKKDTESRGIKADTQQVEASAVERLVKWVFKKKQYPIHFYAERDHSSGSCYQEGCVDVDAKLTKDAVKELRIWLDGEFDKLRPDNKWTGETKIKSITILTT